MSAGAVVWFTGLPASGKSTLARTVSRRLERRGRRPILLDSDELRDAIAVGLGYGPKARSGFYAALANLAVLLAKQGHVVLVAATAHRRAYRDRARKQAGRFLEVFVDAPLEDCRGRDIKGLYRLAAKGKLRSLPGVGVRYEAPVHPEVVARGGRDAEAVARLIRLLA
ncbi:MAG: cysC [Myxococcaceae bacterium]|nr:cysC [Myxococcaceae bacterium]